MYINICGIRHKIIFEKCAYQTGETINLGCLDPINAIITINPDANEEVRNETICHEIIHAILFRIGRDELGVDETFVQSLANAIYQSFVPKVESDEVEKEDTENEQ